MANQAKGSPSLPRGQPIDHLILEPLLLSVEGAGVPEERGLNGIPGISLGKVERTFAWPLTCLLLLIRFEKNGLIQLTLIPPAGGLQSELVIRLPEPREVRLLT